LTRAFSQLRQGQSVGTVLAVLAVCGICVALILAAAAGKRQTVIMLLLLLVALYIPLLAAHTSRLWLAGLPILVFWMPAPFAFFRSAPLSALSLVEALVVLALFLSAIRVVAARDDLQPMGLKSFPWVGFVLLFAGAAIAYLFAFHTGAELPYIRVIVFFPFALGLLILVVVEDAKDALKLLWILVFSAAVLGIVFLLGSRGVGPFASSAYAAGTGRASLSFSLPYLGSLVINPASAGDKFAMAFSVAWFLLLTSATGPRRLAAGAAACVFAAVVVTAQGRSGLIACVLSVAMLGVWAMRRGSGERLVALSATAAGLALTIGLSLYLAFQSQNAALTARLLVLFSAPQSDTNLVVRTQLWRQGFGLAVSHPLGLGVFSPPYGAATTWAAHNLWLFAALSFGWLGLAGLVLILVRFGRVFIAGFRSADADGARLSVLGLVMLANVLVTGMMSPLVWESYSAVLVWLPLWIAFAGVVRCTHELPNVRS
jgi:hypothetical protein